VIGSVLRPATEADVPRLTELVQAAYGHYVERLGALPRPMTDDYAEVVRSFRVTVAERDGEVVGLIVLGVDLYTHERMTENLALYSRIGYVEYDRRAHGDDFLVYLRKQLGKDFRNMTKDGRNSR
jgi:hypothetical protein